MSYTININGMDNRTIIMYANNNYGNAGNKHKMYTDMYIYIYIYLGILSK